MAEARTIGRLELSRDRVNGPLHGPAAARRLEGPPAASYMETFRRLRDQVRLTETDRVASLAPFDRDRVIETRRIESPTPFRNETA
jgi:hypothetical protein